VFGNEEKHEISTEEIAGQRWVVLSTYRGKNSSFMDTMEKFRCWGFTVELPVEGTERGCFCVLYFLSLVPFYEAIA